VDTDGTGGEAGPRRRVGGLWWRRDFRLLWFGETTSNVGNAISMMAMPLVAVVTLRASTFTVGLLAAAVWLPWLVIGLPAGAWVDRWSRRAVMLVCDLVSLVLLASVPVAAWLGVLTVGQLLVVALLTGVANVFFSTAYSVYLPAVVGPDDLAEGNAKMQGSESAALVAGPGIGGAVTQAFGAVVGLLADAVTFAVSAVCLLGIRVRERPAVPARENASLRREIAEGLRFVARDPYLRVLAGYAASTNLAANILMAILVVFLVRTVGVGPGTVGALLAVMSCGGVAGAALSTTIARRFGTARGLLLCELCTAPFALLIPLTTPGAGLAWFAVGGFVVEMGIVASNVIFGAFRQSYCPPSLLGRVTAGTRFVVFGAIPLGALLGGALGSALGVRETAWVATALSTLSVLVLLAGPLRTRRDLPARPAGLAAQRAAG
jgi:predicted MFS family arabinose efflux permease